MHLHPTCPVLSEFTISLSHPEAAQQILLRESYMSRVAQLLNLPKKHELEMETLAEKDEWGKGLECQ